MPNDAADFEADVDFEADKVNPAPVNLKPKEYSDSALGLETGPITHKVTVGDRLGLAATPEESAANRARRPVDPMEVDPIAQGIAAELVGQGAGRLVAPVVGAAGPAMARILSGATEGATAAKATGNSPIAGAVLGGAIPGGKQATEGLSNAMNFLVNRVASPQVARSMAREGAKDIAEKYTMPEITAVVRKYKIGSVANPKVDKEAIDASLARAETMRDVAWETVRKTGVAGSGNLAKNPVAALAMKEFNAANTDAKILTALQPGAKKLAAAWQLRPTMLERVGQGAGKAAKLAAGGAGAAGAYKAYKAFSE